MAEVGKDPETLAELRAAVFEHRKALRTCDTQKAAVAWMARAHELMGVCMDRLSKAEEPAPTIIVPQERPRLVVVSNMQEAVRPVPSGQAGFFDSRVKTFVYPVRPDPPRGSVLAPKAWTHADTLRLERESAEKRVAREAAQTAGLKKWIQRRGG